MPENKSKFLIPAVGAAVVVAGSVAAYMYFKGASGDASSPLASAKVVPDEAMIATFISTDPKPWSQLQQFGTPAAQQLVEKSLQDFNKQMLTESNIDYQKELLPWVGSIMVAVLPSSPASPAQATPQPAQKSNVLMVIGIKDKVSAFNFANKLKAEKGVESKESDYKGQKIIEPTGKGEPTYSAVLNDHLVLAQELKAVEQAIDTFKGEPSFASVEGADSFLSKGVDLKNSIAQIYIPDYASVTQQLIANSPNAPQLSPAKLAQLQQVKSVIAGVGIDDAGLRMKAIAKIDPEANKVEYQPSPGKMVARFPGETIALISGQGISRHWSAFVEQTQTSPEFKQGIDQVRQQLKTINLDLDKDIFGWMDGEFAIAAIPSNQGLLAAVGFGGALVFDTSDRKTAQATFDKLDALAKSNFITVGQRNVQGKTVTEWQIPLQSALVGHGWLDEDTVFVAVGGPIADAIATPPNQALDTSENFKAVTGALLKPNGGYFYLDMDKTMSVLSSKPQSAAISPEASAILNSIRGIGMTTTSPDESTNQVEMLLGLKPATAK